MTKPPAKVERPHGGELAGERPQRGEQPDQAMLDQCDKEPRLIITWVDGKMVETWVPFDAPDDDLAAK